MPRKFPVPPLKKAVIAFLVVLLSLVFFWGLGYAFFPDANHLVGYEEIRIQRDRAFLVQKIQELKNGVIELQSFLYDQTVGLENWAERLGALDRTFRDISASLEEFSPSTPALEGYATRLKGVLAQLGKTISSISLYIAAPQPEEKDKMRQEIAAELSGIHIELISLLEGLRD
ncbi:MAG: hypothetical protein QW260_06120 [Thermoproteota archaeon]